MSSSNNSDPPNYDQIPVDPAAEDPAVRAVRAQLQAAEAEARRRALAEKEQRLQEVEAKEKRAAALDEATRREERKRAQLNELEELKRKASPAKARRITGAPGEGASDKTRREAVNVKDGVLQRGE